MLVQLGLPLAVAKIRFSENIFWIKIIIIYRLTVIYWLTLEHADDLLSGLQNWAGLLSEIIIIMIRNLRAYFTMQRGRRELRERKYLNNLKNKILAIESNEVLIYATMDESWKHLTKWKKPDTKKKKNNTYYKSICMKCSE